MKIKKSHKYLNTFRYGSLSRMEKDGIRKLLEAVRKDKDLLPWKSRMYYKDGYYLDHLEAFAGITHYHLGLKIDNRGLRKSTDNLLFARIKGNTFYVLDVVYHPKGAGWADISHISLLEECFPELVNRAPDSVVGLYMNPTAEEAHRLQKAGLVFMRQTPNGTIVLPERLYSIGEGKKARWAKIK